MQKLRSVTVVALLLLAGAPLWGQDPSPPAKPAGQKVPSFIFPTADFFHALFTAPVHPVVRGVAPGGGPGAGIGVTIAPNDDWLVDAHGVITTNGYRSGQAITGYRGERARLELYGRVRDISKLAYYGPGNASAESDQTNFRLREQNLGVTGAYRPTDWLTIGARVEDLRDGIHPGHSDDRLSIEQRFSNTDAPGLISQPRFGRYDVSLAVRLPAGAGEHFFQGAQYRVTRSRFDDRDLDQFSFQRLEVEARHQFALFRPRHRLTLHGWYSSSEAESGHQVPFYLQRTLGGSGDLESVDETLLGGDDSQASLRGFDNFRFRDRQLLLLQAEYRVQLWRMLHATAFVDAGKVAHEVEDLDLNGLRHDYGFSLSLMRKSTAFMRIDVGWGGGEGAHLFFRLFGDALR